MPYHRSVFPVAAVRVDGIQFPAIAVITIINPIAYNIDTIGTVTAQFLLVRAVGVHRIQSVATEIAVINAPVRHSHQSAVGQVSAGVAHSADVGRRGSLATVVVVAAEISPVVSAPDEESVTFLHAVTDNRRKPVSKMATAFFMDAAPLCNFYTYCIKQHSIKQQIISFRQTTNQTILSFFTRMTNEPFSLMRKVRPKNDSRKGADEFIVPLP